MIDELIPLNLELVVFLTHPRTLCLSVHKD